MRILSAGQQKAAFFPCRLIYDRMASSLKAKEKKSGRNYFDDCYITEPGIDSKPFVTLN